MSSHMSKTQDDFKKKMLDMDEFWQFPCCWVAIDGCHIPIKCPPGGLEACEEYHKKLLFHSTNGAGRFPLQVFMGQLRLPG